MQVEGEKPFKSVRLFYPREIALTQLQELQHRARRCSSTVVISPTMMIVSQLALHAMMLASPAAAAVPRAASARVRTPLLSGAASGPPTDVVAYKAAGDVPFRVAYDANSELEEDKEYEVESLLFVGMVRTMRDEGVRGLLSAPVLLGLASGLLKITLTIAFVFRFYMEHYNNMGHWGQLLSKCPTWHDAAGLVSSLIVVPAFLLHRLSGTSEFKDGAVMWATLQRLQAKHKRKLLYAVWSVVHVVRVYLKLPCFILANARAHRVRDDGRGERRQLPLPAGRHLRRGPRALDRHVLLRPVQAVLCERVVYS